MFFFGHVKNSDGNIHKLHLTSEFNITSKLILHCVGYWIRWSQEVLWIILFMLRPTPFFGVGLPKPLKGWKFTPTEWQRFLKEKLNHECPIQEYLPVEFMFDHAAQMCIKHGFNNSCAPKAIQLNVSELFPTNISSHRKLPYTIFRSHKVPALLLLFIFNTCRNCFGGKMGQ